MCVPPVGTHSASGLLTALCQQSAALDWGGSARHTTRPPACAQVAQLAEQGTENPRVGGSIPPLGTNSAGLAVPARPACLEFPSISVPTDALAMQSGRAARACKSRRRLSSSGESLP